ncbi:hypothetical protein MOQ72_38010 [Saccharopolyspora sp. K220]|uniref:hypothetical protein n=1 Tax=Saccharopolyspora soli TaxID=2926618 RepID=UPI001F58E6CD|nr:hypothetical protein [Saccharopolyspora soli]MCI2423231.1 hypothetical protein [Saccharopolyspora soli]
MSIPRLSWRAGCALFAALLAAGCGSSLEGAAPATTTVPPADTVVPSTTTTTTAPPPVIAADGTNYAACADGTCEISLSQPVNITLNGGTLAVTSVNPDGIDIDLSLDNGGGGNGTLKGTCGAIFRFHSGGGGDGRFCNPDGSVLPPPEPEPGVVALQLVGLSDGAAVLRVVSG